jgi:hypothetical protein
MASDRAGCTASVLWILSLAFGLASTASMAFAQDASRDVAFLVASGFLCDPVQASSCPAVVKSASGETFEMSGAGTFNTQGKSVTAAGTFTQKSFRGTVLKTGVWVATELVSFDSYGIAPGALMRGGRTFGPALSGPRRSRMFSGPMPTGGFAVFRIRLFAIPGTPENALLQVNCALGKVPPERQVEGIRFTLERNGAEFSEEVSGRTMFLLLRPDGSAPAKTPQQEAAPESVETPRN